MTPKSLIGLAVVTAAAVAAAVVVAGGTAADSAVADRGRALLPDLVRTSASIESLAITAGKTTTTLTRDGDRFVDASGYPARLDTVRKLVSSLAALTIDEDKTDKPDRYVDLGLADPAADDGAATKVALLDKEGKPVAAVYAGTKDYTVGGSRGGQYVRLDGNPQSYLVRGSLDMPTARADWFDARLTDIKPAALAKVTLTDAAGASVDFTRTGDKLLPAALPDGKAPDEGKANRVTAFLQGFDFTDVRKETPASIGNTTRLRYETTDGLTVTATAVPAADDAGKGWIRIAAEAVDPKAADAAKAINDKAAGYEFKVNTIHTEMFGWTVANLAKEG
ncbi:conserved exported hypothetical protein [uncultured Pleomorphomonas sp.]|uniref:DUF4340 domain-containing protein n=1 Tax=uncultured Pleomorphomonas sp. TaxID=442121 RepID=A0A212LGP1_9HYPH|nr:DUF4340 domain-containing protein [uncultured Pleomorphomonas sp.]SCM76732.1 conserved exported hypothetical protein [uncultured Pleomorphomonas sp.]